MIWSADCCISTTQLCRHISGGQGKKSLLIPIPLTLLQFVASLIGNGKTVEKLCGSLVVDPSYVIEKLCWDPKTTYQAGLKEMGAAYDSGQGGRS